MIRLVNKKDVERLKTIFLSTRLISDIEIKKDNINLIVTDVSENTTENEWGNDEFYLLNNNDDKPLRIKNKYYDLSVKVGWWRDTYRIRNAHVTLGSNCSRLGLFFCQLELSQALQDSNYIYLVKNLFKLAGDGSIARLNRGLKYREEKIDRRYELLNLLDADIIKFDREEWFVVSKISKQDLEEENDEHILHEFLKDFLNYSLTIEQILLDAENDKNY